MMGAVPSRRALLGFAGAGAILLAATPGQALGSQSDQLEALFSQWKNALYRLNNDDADASSDNPLWQQLNEAEDAIVRSREIGSRIAAMRLWIALDASSTTLTVTNAICREDLGTILRVMPDQDWGEQTLIQALAALS